MLRRSVSEQTQVLLLLFRIAVNSLGNLDVAQCRDSLRSSGHDYGGEW